MTFDLQSNGCVAVLCKNFVGFQAKEELPDSEDKNGGKDIEIAEINGVGIYTYRPEIDCIKIQIEKSKNSILSLNKCMLKN